MIPEGIDRDGYVFCPFSDSGECPAGCPSNRERMCVDGLPREDPRDPGRLCPPDPWDLPAGPVRRGADAGGPCDHCRCLGSKHWIEEHCCDCGACPGYQVTPGPHEHYWDRHTSEEAGLGRFTPIDVLSCECGRTRQVPHDPAAWT